MDVLCLNENHRQRLCDAGGHDRLMQRRRQSPCALKWSHRARGRISRMWTVQSEALAGQRGLRCTVAYDDRPAPFAAVFQAWRSDTDFRTLFNAWLADAPYSAFRWETPAVSSDTLMRPFEFVLLDSPGLERPADPE